MTMKVRIPNHVAIRSLYLTKGKIYTTLEEDSSMAYYHITDDVGEVRFIRLYNCAHLSGANWEVVPEEIPS